ncbi:MAG TPA: hypothetical protein VIG91_05485, partial [Terriglobales bacterium]
GNRSQHISLRGHSPQIREDIRTVEASVVRAGESNDQFCGSRGRFIFLILERDGLLFAATIAYDFLMQRSISESGSTSKLSNMAHL